MQRIQTELAQQHQLVTADEAGDLMLRIRPGRDVEGQRHGWQTLVRLTSVRSACVAGACTICPAPQRVGGSSHAAPA